MKFQCLGLILLTALGGCGDPVYSGWGAASAKSTLLFKVDQCRAIYQRGGQGAAWADCLVRAQEVFDAEIGLRRPDISGRSAAVIRRLGAELDNKQATSAQFDAASRAQIDRNWQWIQAAELNRQAEIDQDAAAFTTGMIIGAANAQAVTVIPTNTVRPVISKPEITPAKPSLAAAPTVAPAAAKSSTIMCSGIATPGLITGRCDTN